MFRKNRRHVGTYLFAQNRLAQTEKDYYEKDYHPKADTDYQAEASQVRLDNVCCRWYVENPTEHSGEDRMTNKVRVDEFVIDGVTYVPKDSATPPVNKEGLPYVVVRSRDAGVFAGYKVFEDGMGEVRLVQARRLWQWAGAASLSQLAVEGVNNPGGCKFAVPVTVTVLGVCEILDTTEKARTSIEGVKEWRA